MSGFSAIDEGHSRRAAAAHFRVSVSFVVNLVKAFRVRGSLAPKPSGGRRHAKLEPHRAFLLEKIAKKADITMPELAPTSSDRDGFAKLKALLRARAVRTIDALWRAIGEICDLFSPQECQNYFNAAGYGFT